MPKVMFIPLNQNHVLIFEGLINSLDCKCEVLCHDNISEAKQYYTEALLIQKKLPYRMFPQVIKRTEEDSIIKRIFDFFKIKKQVAKILTEYSPDLIVFAIDNDPISQIIIAAAKQREIKTMLIPEGLIKPQDFFLRKTYRSDYFYKALRILGIYIKYIKYGEGDCNIILVSGKRALAVLKRNGIPETKMTIVGQQKYDSFLAQIKDIKPPLNNPKKYLYAASTRIFIEDEERQFVKKLIKYSQIIGLKLIIKLHPRILQKPEELTALLNVEELNCFEIIKEGYDTFDILKTVDGIITISSAIVLEGLMMDKECIAANYLAGRRCFDYEKYDAIYTLNNEDEIYDVLKDSSINKKSFKNKRRLLEDEIYKLDSKAVQRTVSIIESMIETQPS